MQGYFDAAVAALQGSAEPASGPPPLRPAPHLERFLGAQLSGAAQRVGRAPQAELEAPLEQLEAASPPQAKVHLARHLT